MLSSPSPAHHTKHLALLHYPFFHSHFNLIQLDDGTTNGTALWLGAQCISLYLADISQKLQNRPTINRRPRAIELGSGIGLTAWVAPNLARTSLFKFANSAYLVIYKSFSLALSSLGWDVLATDVSHVVDAVLDKNITTNRGHLPTGHGTIQVRELDWMASPEAWDWENDKAITPLVGSVALERKHSDSDSLRPPFDLVVTSDTLYTDSLCMPLLRTLHGLCVQSLSHLNRAPPIYVCVERRDPALIDRALSAAKADWGFAVERVPHKKLVRAMGKGGIRWSKDDWEGMEIWKLTLG